MPVVEPEVESAVCAPTELVDGQPLAIEREHHGEIPGEHVHAQAAAPLHDFVQKVSERLRKAVVRTLRHESNAAVDVPAEYVDAASGARDRPPHGPEIGFAVDEKGHALRTLDAPAVAAGYEQTGALGDAW